MMHLSQHEFCLVLDREFETDQPAVGPFTLETRIADLELDSLQVVRLVAFVESLGEFDLPDELEMSFATVGDLYHYYSVLTQL